MRDLIASALLVVLGLGCLFILTRWGDDRHPLLIDAANIQQHPQILISPCLTPPGSLWPPKRRIERV